jgi:Cu-Zn family superoxide dismutase
MRHSLALALLLSTALAASPALAASVVAELALATPTGPGASVGTVEFKDTPQGATITLDLHGLPPGQHGFHLHQNASCQPATAPDGTVTPAGAAGGHFDPDMNSHHMGPDGMGHLGDLPRVDVAADGTAKLTLTAPRIKDVSKIANHALMFHAGGDNYSDTPPLGGGGKRLACGVLN